MIYDACLILCGAIAASGAITGQACNGAGNIVSTNTIDLGPAGLGGLPGQLGDIGSGKLIVVDFHVRTAPTVGTSVQFQLIQADDPALTVNVQVLVSSGDIPIASLPAGRHVYLELAPLPFAARRYFGARIVNVGAIATFSVYAAVVADAQSPLDRTLLRSGYGMA